MIKKFLNSEDYQECFKFDGYVPFIISYNFIKSYKDLEGVAFFHEGRWYSYISLKAVKKSLKEGVNIYSSSEKYEKLRYKTYQTEKEITKIYELIIKEGVSKDKLSTFFSLLEKFRILYRKTEFFYTDLAFEKLEEFPDIKKNFSSFGDFKIDGRTALNNIFFSPKSHFVKVIEFVASFTKVSRDKLMLCSTDEIMDLVKKDKLNTKEIDKRKDSYFIYSEKNKIVMLSGENAKMAINKFVKISLSKEIKGKTAQIGVVRAFAKVIKVNIKNYDKMSEVVDEMKKGEVLVAETTEPSIILACQKASAIVTNQGGMMSHAAIVARELKIPCIVGTNNATEMINDGDFIEVDADKGIVKIIERAKK
ncbi:MAG: PEP-utilizing enzyme [Nanoarchaeota archaeon]